jgi:GTP-binding protein
MKISRAQYWKSLVPGATLPDGSQPLVAFIGRSNVGKSSFINAITGQKDLCRSGSSPGVTRKINLFLINNGLLFADLPGYGYAKMSRGERKKLEELIFWFFGLERIRLQQVFLLIDSRHGPTESDLEIAGFIGSRGIPLTIILSKTDKLNASQKAASLKAATALLPHHEIVPFSVFDRDAIKTVLKKLGD